MASRTARRTSPAPPDDAASHSAGATRSRWQHAWPWILILLVGAVPYANSFHTPFVFDSIEQIQLQEVVRQVWPLERFITHNLRPLPTFTFALNYAWGGYDVVGYHVVNLAIHLVVALLLYDWLRRTFARSAWHDSIRNAVPGLALATTLLWVSHPLHTQVVTNIVQRMEALMSLGIVLMLAAQARGIDAPLPRGWLALSIVGSWLAVTSKEVGVVAPLLALAYDRLLVSPTWSALWRTRGPYYGALASCWLPLAGLLVLHAGNYESGGAGIVAGLGPFSYLTSQAGVLVHYVRLIFVPWPLCFDYHWAEASTWHEIIGPGLFVVAGLIATVVGWRRWPAASFWGVWFFTLLAPTSSIIPIADLAVEHRLYLPSLGIIALAVLAVARGLAHWNPLSARMWGAWLCGVLIVVEGGIVWRRNLDYRSSLTIWFDTVVQRPQNPRAHFNLSSAYVDERQDLPRAIAHLRRAVDLLPGYDQAYLDLAKLLVKSADFDGAVPVLGRALTLNPQQAEAWYHLALAYEGRRQSGLAEEAYRRTVELKPDHAEAWNNLGLLHLERGDVLAAEEAFRRALSAEPTLNEGRLNLALSLLEQGQADQARAELDRTLERDPNLAKAWALRGLTWGRQGETRRAIDEYARAVELEPDMAPAHLELARLLLLDPMADRETCQRALRHATRAVELVNHSISDWEATQLEAQRRLRETITGSR